VDDVGSREGLPVDVRLEDVRFGTRALHLDVQVAIDMKTKLPTALRAVGDHVDRDRLFPQAPLHEGRCHHVLGSGPVQSLAGAEGQPVRGSIDGHRIGPGDTTRIVAHEKEELALELVENLDHTIEP